MTRDSGELIPRAYIAVSYTHLDVYKRQAYTTQTYLERERERELEEIYM